MSRRRIDPDNAARPTKCVRVCDENVSMEAMARPIGLMKLPPAETMV